LVLPRFAPRIARKPTRERHEPHFGHRHSLTVAWRRAGRIRIAVLETDGGQLRLRSARQAGFTPDMVQRIRMVPDSAVPQLKAAVR
jgi:hypothetical protein